MRGTTTHRLAAALLLGSLVLSGCTERVSERCSGSNGEHSCTFTYKTSDGQWSTRLEGGSTSTEAVIDGTITVESGSGTVLLGGADESFEYPISADEPVVIEDLALAMNGKRSESWIYFEVTADPQIDGLTAEITYRTS
ncbi:hypothetical protein ACXET9_15445 [Brachybacterium sp. DNPG3]